MPIVEDNAQVVLDTIKNEDARYTKIVTAACPEHTSGWMSRHIFEYWSQPWLADKIGPAECQAALWEVLAGPDAEPGSVD